ncbi:MAG: hypothetical protein P0111_10400 [Nitrospira sp.]|nr:hypothetical protein [Nitrospira sp.]
MTGHRQPLLKPPYGCLLLLVGTLGWFPAGAFATDTKTQGSLGGVYFRAECPIGSFLVGFSGRTGAWIDQIAPVCEPLSPNKQTFGKFTVGATIGTSTGGTPDHSRCPAHTVVRVTRHSMTIGENAQLKFVESISYDCFTTAGAFRSDGRRIFGHPTELPVIDTTSKPLDTLTQCPQGEFARGFHGRAGQFLNALGLICGPLVPRKSGTAVPSDAPHTTAAFPTAPTINLPQGFLVKGKGVFQITPSKYLTGTQAQIQLKWLNPPAHFQGKGLDFYTYEVPMSLIAGPSGIAAPDSYLAPGTWEMRVRINQPKVGDWSQPVRFEYYLQNPAVAPRAETPLSVEGQKKRSTMGGGTSAFRPQTTPSAGLGNTTVILPRGIDEKGGSESNQTVDMPVEMEKQP